MDRPFNHVASFVGLGFDVLEVVHLFNCPSALLSGDIREC